MAGRRAWGEVLLEAHSFLENMLEGLSVTTLPKPPTISCPAKPANCRSDHTFQMVPSVLELLSSRELCVCWSSFMWLGFLLVLFPVPKSPSLSQASVPPQPGHQSHRGWFRHGCVTHSGPESISPGASMGTNPWEGDAHTSGFASWTVYNRCCWGPPLSPKGLSLRRKPTQREAN